MGWMFEQDWHNDWWLFDDNNGGEAIMDFMEWHPDTSIKQAMMCVNKAFGAEYSIDISFYKHQVIIFYKGKPIAQAGFVSEDTLPLAICEAILEAILKTI